MAPGQTILVTGSSRGVGRLLVEHYVGEGHVVFGCSRSESEYSHERYHHIVADVGRETDVLALFAEIARSGGRLDLLLNNAGLSLDRYALLTTGSDAESILRANILGPFLVARQAIKSMKRQRFGRIINFSSINVPLGSIGSSIYSASKAALEHLGYTLSREVAADGITINTIGLSLVAGSGMVAALTPEALAEKQQGLLKPELLDVAEIIHAIDFFASKNAGNITNQIIYFGGVR